MNHLARKANPTWEYYKSIVFVLFLIELLLCFIGIIFGGVLGHKTTLTACFWLGVIVAAVFVSIALANLAVICFHDRYRRMKNKSETSTVK